MEQGITTRRHARYQQKLPAYSVTYTTTVRAIGRWIRRGKAAGDLPPLDDPEQMAAWWRRCMDHQVPDKLLGFQKSEDSPPSENSQQPNLPPNPPAAPTEPRDFSDVRGLDLGENVEALRHTHAINKKLLDEALTGQDENRVTLRQKNFERSFTLLRLAESSLLDLQQKRGDLISREQVRTDIAQFLEALRLMHGTMPGRILTEIEKLLPRRAPRLLRLLTRFLTPAIEICRAKEESAFRQLTTVENPERLEQLLVA